MCICTLYKDLPCWVQQISFAQANATQNRSFPHTQNLSVILPAQKVPSQQAVRAS
jgi:hypothetical protein